MSLLFTQTLCRATLKEKSYKKVQGKPDRSARFAGPAPPHCLRGIVVLESTVGLTMFGVGM